jgi:hypothetical protein
VADLMTLLNDFRRDTQAVMPGVNPAPETPFTKW